MLKKNHSVATILRAFNSTLSVDYTAAEAIKTSSPIALERAPGGISRGDERSIRVVPSTIRDRLNKLEGLYTVPDVKYKSHAKECVPTNKLRANLRKRQHIKFLVDVMIQDHLNDKFIAQLFHEKDISRSEFSVFINRLLQEGDLKTKLSNIIPDTVHTELLFRLFQIYCTHVVGSQEGKLTVGELHDINLFIKTFIDEAQLGKAQQCLQFILDRQGLQHTLNSGDVSTIINFLKLRCGAVVTFWEASHCSKRMLGQNSSSFNAPKAFKSWNSQDSSKVLSVLLKDKSWLRRNSTALDSAIIYSLSSMGQMKHVEQYITLKWGVSLEGTVEVNNAVAPDAGTLIAILSSFCLKNNDISKGLTFIDQLLKKYPQINLETLFWRRLLQLSSQAWDKRRDKKGQMCHGSWDIMKQWYDGKGINMSYDHGTLELLYQLFKTLNNGREAMEVIKRFFGSVYAKQNYQIAGAEMILLLKFQKLAIRTMALKGNYHKPLQFIKEWHVDEVNQQQLLQYFTRQREKYALRREKVNAKRDQLQAQYDAMEEEDMLLGRLW